MSSTNSWGSDSNPSILVIDSGIGGLSVCQSIHALLPNLSLVYFADKEYFPYGLMSEKALISRLNDIVEVMLAKHKPALVVLACNTVSTLLLPSLRSRFDVPFVGVVPAIKPAAAMSKSKRIGLLATPATVKRSYTDDLIAEHASDCDVVRLGSNNLVIEAENLLKGLPVSRDVVLEEIKPFLVTRGGKSVDTVVLGCTHFPLLKSLLLELAPNIRWIDSGEAIARRVASLLFEPPSERDMRKPALHRLYFSKDAAKEGAVNELMRKLDLALFEVHEISL